MTDVNAISSTSEKDLLRNSDLTRLRTPRATPLDHYTHYLDPSFPIDKRLDAAFNELGISNTERRDIEAFLAPLKTKHIPTYEHCIRVGLLAKNIGSFLQLDAKALFRAGILHDIGKAQVPFELLDKTLNWTAKDSSLMRRHVMDGYRLLQGKFDFSAEIILWHHREPKAIRRKDPILPNQSQKLRQL